MIGGGKKRHTTKQGFKPVEDMIKSVGTDFSILTAESLFGFMLTMRVPSENAEYLGPSANGKKMTTPITEYLLKISVITERHVRLQPILWNGRSRVKSSEDVISFYREAKLQQKLWLHSIMGGKQPVCPDVYSISYDCGDMLFSSSSSSSSASTVKRRHLNHPEVYDYLMTRHTEGFKLGAIAMEYIPNSRSLYSILFGPDIDDAYRNLACINAGAQVVRLFLDYGIIHVDLHAENVIVDESGMAYIIDFGRVLNLDEPDPYELRLVRIKELRRTYLEVLSKRPDRRDATSGETIKTLCRDIFNELKNIEMEIYHSFQMISLHTFLEDNAETLYYPVMVKYHELSSSGGIGLSRDAITTKIKSGEIELIEDQGLDAIIQQTIDAFHARPPPPPPPVLVTGVARPADTPTAMLPFTSATIATVALPPDRHSENNTGIGITKNKRPKNKRKKTRFKKRRR